MRLYFMRHGQTEYNLQGLCNDDPRQPNPLTALGRAQAAKAAARLGEAQPACIVVSELPRTQETAAIINARFGVPIEIEPAFNDWRTGLDGEPVTELYRYIAADPLNTRVKTGETLREHHARVHAAIAALCLRAVTEILVIAHEETLRAASSYFHALSDTEMLALHFGNTALLEFDA